LDLNATKKFKEPSKEPSSMPNLILFLSEEVIGETKLVKPIPFPVKLQEKEDPLESDLSPDPEVQELSVPLSPKKLCNSPEFKMFILQLKE
jgi:hypothetical protein